MESKSINEKVFSLLNQKSAEARALVKQSILRSRIGIKKVDKTIEQYLLRWDDTTRPGVLALACEAVGGSIEEVVPLQVALLFIDATMDIHDDIIDESAFKKNRKTVYGKLGKEIALLIGDTFMVKGFSYLHRTLENLPRDRQVRIMDAIEDFLSEVVEAHILETTLKTKKWTIRPKTYFQILAKKAADIEGRMKVGAVFGKGSEKEIEALSRYGRKIGTLLAVKSEFADLFEPTELMHRIKNEFLPLPALYALNNPKLGKQIREILERHVLSKEDCEKLVEIIYNTTEVDLLKQKLYVLEKEALHLLNLIPNTRAKEGLHQLAVFMINDL